MRTLIILATLAACGTSSDPHPDDTGTLEGACDPAPARIDGWVCVHTDKDVNLLNALVELSATGTVRAHGPGDLEDLGLGPVWETQGCPTGAMAYTVQIDGDDGHTWQISWNLGDGGPPTSALTDGEPVQLRTSANNHGDWYYRGFAELVVDGNPILLFEENGGASNHGRYGIEAGGEAVCNIPNGIIREVSFEAAGGEPLTLLQGEQGILTGTDGGWAVQLLDAVEGTCDHCVAWERWAIWPAP